MSRRVAALGFVFLAAVPLRAADPEADLAARIDAHIAAKLRAANVVPAPLASDAEFLRRVSLDLAGRIPSVAEAIAFFADPAPNKRRRLVERLVQDPRHVEHFTNVWRALLVPEYAANPDLQFQAAGIDAWLRKQLADNVSYDRFARDLLTVPFAPERVRGKAMKMEEPRSANDPSPQAFYVAKEGKPEALAAATARVFLGVRIECAQCHDHPNAPWTRQQFWGYAAFFAGLARPAEQGAAIREVFDKREMTIPGSGQVVDAAYLDGSEPQWRFNVSSRVTLAEWVTSPENPYFAKAAVNRLWAHLFGTGLVSPEDDLRPDNAASHPELLDELARAFVAHKFDVRFLIRAITATEAYQRSSAVQAHGQRPAGDVDSRLFARMAVKRLTPEQLFDSLAQATGYREPVRGPGDGDVVNLGRGGPRAQFLALFANGAATRTDPQLSIPQALGLMNGGFVVGALTTNRPSLTDFVKQVAAERAVPGGPTFLPAVANDPSLNTAGRVERLFLATLTRRPTAAESEKLVRYVEGGGPAHDAKRALADVYWALLNSAEFLVNH
ncbi:MAG TPA: DUF1549 and DUF1553 domain-containing protein [Gemmataceae bacterium]|jgi:hypothetical protein